MPVGRVEADAPVLSDLLNRRRTELDRVFAGAVVLLIIVGLALVFSADHAQETRVHFTRQLYFAAAGIVIMAAAAALPWRFYYAMAYPVYGLALLLLATVLVAGRMGYGAQRWLELGGINIQPSEPAKIAFVMAASRALAFRHGAFSNLRNILSVVALAAVPTLLVVLQPDLGTATTFPVLGGALLAWFGLPASLFVLLALPFAALFLTVIPWLVAPLLLLGLGYLRLKGTGLAGIILVALLCATASLAAPLAWERLEPYQQKRLETFLNPAADKLGAGYQVIQSKVAIGSGGFTGRGYLKGTQTQLRFLPLQHTDFIFALAGEELGFAGTSVILLLLLIIIWRGFTAAGRAKSEFAGLLAAGLTVMLFYHAAVNIGMAVGVLPVTGLPLPFLSYGGSFLLTCMTAAGMLLSVGIHRREY